MVNADISVGKVLVSGDCEWLVLNENLYHNLYPTPTAQGTSQERGQEECMGRRRGGGLYTVSCGPDMAPVLTNSQQLWFPTQDLHKMEPVSISAWMEKGFVMLAIGC